MYKIHDMEWQMTDNKVNTINQYTTSRWSLSRACIGSYIIFQVFLIPYECTACILVVLFKQLTRVLPLDIDLHHTMLNDELPNNSE